MNAADLEELGCYLSDCGRHDLLRHIGDDIWWRWEGEIMAGKHPRRSYLLAFLRYWATPVGDWLPPGMAHYLADRLDPKVKIRDRGGRPGDKRSKKLEEAYGQLSIAVDVLQAWERHKIDETPYPQKAAIKTVADDHGVPADDVHFAFVRFGRTAEVSAKLAEGTAIDSLSDEDLEVLTKGPEPVSHLVIRALTPSELRRLQTGENLDSILRNPTDEESSLRPRLR